LNSLKRSKEIEIKINLLTDSMLRLQRDAVPL